MIMQLDGITFVSSDGCEYTSLEDDPRRILSATPLKIEGWPILYPIKLVYSALPDENEEFYRLYRDVPRQLPRVIAAIGEGGGQACDVAGVLRALSSSGFVIVRRSQIPRGE